MAMNWVSRLFFPRRESRPAAPRLATATAPYCSPMQAGEAGACASAEAQRLFLPWIPGIPCLRDEALSSAEQCALDEVQKLIELANIPDSMLPRAAELVPQLIGMLREAQLPLQAMAERVNKDGVLAAEVMRLASSPFYRSQGNVVDTVQAIQLIGSMGLQTVIARVVLKPIYRSAASAMGANVSARLWEHSEALARHMAALAQSAGQDAFDGYLVGMLHNTGWKVALGAIERAGIALDSQPSAAFASALVEQIHRLFGHAAQRWKITPGFVAFVDDARHHGLAGGAHALVLVLQQAQLRCMEEAFPS